MANTAVSNTAAPRGRVGSTPASPTNSRVAQLVERRTLTPNVAGSSPASAAMSDSRVAQLVEQQTLNLTVAGSSPALTATRVSSNGRTSVFQTEGESSILSTRSIYERGAHRNTLLGELNADTATVGVVYSTPRLSARVRSQAAKAT
jgi:hypothetical protein